MSSIFDKIAHRFTPEEIGVTLVTIVTALPLIHVPGNALVSIQLQSLSLVMLGVIVMAHKPFFDVLWTNLRALGLASKIGLALFVTLAGISSFLSHVQPLAQTLLGGIPEYIGLAQWFSFIILGFIAQDQFKNIKNSFAIPLIVSIVVLLSIFSDRALLFTDFQLSGLLFQATSLALYACLGTAFLLGNFTRHYKKRPILTIACLAVLTTGVFLAQSRIGLFAYALMCAVSLSIKPTRIKTLILGLTAMLMIIAHLVSPHFSSRYQSEAVSNGLQYRRSIYTTSIREIGHKHLIIGNGAGAHPEYLNQQKEVPADIANDLHTGLRFASAHDLLIDIGLMFGLIPCLAAILAILCVSCRYLVVIRYAEVPLTLAFFVLLFGVLINVPSLTLTPLFIIFLIAGLSTQHAHRR